MNNQLLKNIQYALKHEGYLICIPTTQFFNPQSERFVKVFHIRHHKKELYSSSSLVKIIMFCASLLNIVKEAKNVRNQDKYITEHIKELEEKINGTTQKETGLSK